MTVVAPSSDVVVVGSGAAGLLAAHRAAVLGRRVTVLERDDAVGGTTAVSGGVLWVPANPVAAAAGSPDDPDLALRYLEAVTRGSVPRERLEWFVRTGARMVSYLTEHTPVEVVPLQRPDHEPTAPGAMPGGRSLDVRPVRHDPTSANGLHVRPPTYLPDLTMTEIDVGIPDAQERGAERRRTGTRTMGGALVAGLLRGALELGVEVRVGSRVLDVVPGRQRRWQVVVEGVGAVEADDVVLAGGGFERHPHLTAELLPHLVPVGAPGNEGDCLRIGRSRGAVVEALDTWWAAPVLVDPETRYGGAPTGRIALREIGAPGTVLVDRHGARVLETVGNYHDVGLTVAAVAAGTDGDGPPTWLVLDADAAGRTSVGGAPPGVTPPWALVADDLAALAGAAGIDPAGLRATIVATDGAGPFTAVPVWAGMLGTSGGLVTDARAGVCTADGRAVPGLYAVGNAAATVFGGTYPGNGASLGLGLTRAFAVGSGLEGGE